MVKCQERENALRAFGNPYRQPVALKSEAIQHCDTEPRCGPGATRPSRLRHLGVGTPHCFLDLTPKPRLPPMIRQTESLSTREVSVCHLNVNCVCAEG